LNSTWGGSLTDMVRAQRYLEIIEEDNLIENAKDVGAFFLSYFNKVISQDILLSDKIQNLRGIGLMISFDIAETSKRTEFINLCFDNKLFVLPCGEKSIRLRPSLTFSCADSLRAISIIRKCLHELYNKPNRSG
jgi:L-lysine 6-transaminase